MEILVYTYVLKVKVHQLIFRLHFGLFIFLKNLTVLLRVSMFSKIINFIEFFLKKMINAYSIYVKYRIS